MTIGSCPIHNTIKYLKVLSVLYDVSNLFIGTRRLYAVAIHQDAIAIGVSKSCYKMLVLTQVFTRHTASAIHPPLQRWVVLAHYYYLICFLV